MVSGFVFMFSIFLLLLAIIVGVSSINGEIRKLYIGVLATNEKLDQIHTQLFEMDFEQRRGSRLLDGWHP